MIEGPPKNEEIRNLEAGFVLLSIYKEYCRMKLEVLKVGKLVDSSSYFLLQDFSKEYDEVKASMSALIAKFLEEGYGDPLLLDKKARGEDKGRIEEEIRKIREKAIELRKKLLEELNFSLEVLSSIVESYPVDRIGMEPSFLAGRLRELPSGLEFRPPIYLGVFIGLITSYMPRVEESPYDLNIKLDDIKATLLSISKGFEEKIGLKLSSAEEERIRHLLKEIDYIKFYINRYNQLLPGAKKLVEEIEAEVFPLKGRKI